MDEVLIGGTFNVTQKWAHYRKCTTALKWQILRIHRSFACKLLDEVLKSSIKKKGHIEALSGCAIEKFSSIVRPRDFHNSKIVPGHWGKYNHYPSFTYAVESARWISNNSDLTYDIYHPVKCHSQNLNPNHRKYHQKLLSSMKSDRDGGLGP